MTAEIIHDQNEGRRPSIWDEATLSMTRAQMRLKDVYRACHPS